MNKKGVVNIHGKEYITVGKRVYDFREKFPKYRLLTEIIVENDNKINMKAKIKDDDNNIISTGYSEEIRSSSNINKTSALENAETSAVGRALAFFHGDYMGTDYNIASAEEIQQARKRQRQNPDEPFYLCNANQILEFDKALKELVIVEDLKERFLMNFHDIKKENLQEYHKEIKIKSYNRDMKKVFPKGKDWICRLLYILEGIEINTGLNTFNEKIKYLNEQGIEKKITFLSFDELKEIAKQEEKKYQELQEDL